MALGGKISWDHPFYCLNLRIMAATIQMNSTISVDCVVFGFDGTSLKVLLVRRKYAMEDISADDLKLPGEMIRENETLDAAAARVLKEYTGLESIKLKLTGVFSDPYRVSGKELKWICEYHGINTARVITVGYYALVRLDNKMLANTGRKRAVWEDVDSIRSLIMDHFEILSDALSHLYMEITRTPAAFELLPKRFTIRQLQNLFSAVMGVSFDNRNFRKKFLSTGLLIPTDRKESHVAHKPARYYEFNRTAYNKALKERNPLKFLANWAY